MRIAMIQLNLVLGDLAGNFGKIRDAVLRHQYDCDLIVFSELALSGYYPQDLLLRPGFQEESDRYLADLALLTADAPTAVVIGHSEVNHGAGKPFFNALSVLAGGEKVFTYRKRLLCSYDIYDEPRHFEPGSGPATFMLRGVKTGFLICEDAWGTPLSGGPAEGRAPYHGDPVADLAGEKPGLVISINGSPCNFGKQAQRRAVLENVARRLAAPLVYVNQVGGYDAVVYDGASCTYSRVGRLERLLASFRADEGVVSLDPDGCWESFQPYKAPLEDLECLYRQAICGIRDYVAKTGFSGVVIGLSGGIDSAVVAALAAEALGPDNVTGILMPTRHSSQGSIDDAVQLASNLGIRHYLAPIEDEYRLAEESFVQAFGKNPGRLTLENIQARIRGRKLMEFSNDTPGVMVLSTGNKSEVSVGYATLYGDMCGGLNPLGDLYKTDVYALARFHNGAGRCGAIPEASITKAPSAELFDGQKDSDSLPPYPVLDSILKLYIEGTQLSADEAGRCLAAIAGCDQALVEKVVKMVDGAEYKRQQSSTILRLRQLAFGNGRRLPITARCDAAATARSLLAEAGRGAATEA